MDTCSQYNEVLHKEGAVMILKALVESDSAMGVGDSEEEILKQPPGGGFGESAFEKTLRHESVAVPIRGPAPCGCGP